MDETRRNTNFKEQAENNNRSERDGDKKYRKVRKKYCQKNKGIEL